MNPTAPLAIALLGIVGLACLMWDINHRSKSYWLGQLGIFLLGLAGVAVIFG